MIAPGKTNLRPSTCHGGYSIPSHTSLVFISKIYPNGTDLKSGLLNKLPCLTIHVSVKMEYYVQIKFFYF